MVVHPYVASFISELSKTLARSRHQAPLAPLVAGPPVVIVDSLSFNEFRCHIDIAISILRSLSLVNAGHRLGRALSGRRLHSNCGGP